MSYVSFSGCWWLCKNFKKYWINIYLFIDWGVYNLVCLHNDYIMSPSEYSRPSHNIPKVEPRHTVEGLGSWPFVSWSCSFIHYPCGHCWGTKVDRQFHITAVHGYLTPPLGVGSHPHSTLFWLRTMVSDSDVLLYILTWSNFKNKTKKQNKKDENIHSNILQILQRSYTLP